MTNGHVYFWLHAKSAYKILHHAPSKHQTAVFTWSLHMLTCFTSYYSTSILWTWTSRSFDTMDLFLTGIGHTYQPQAGYFQTHYGVPISNAIDMWNCACVYDVIREECYGFIASQGVCNLLLTIKDNMRPCWEQCLIYLGDVLGPKSAFYRLCVSPQKDELVRDDNINSREIFEFLMGSGGIKFCLWPVPRWFWDR